MEFIKEAISVAQVSLDHIDFILLVINSLLLIFASPIIRALSHGETDTSKSKRLGIFRTANLLILLLVLFYNFFIPLAAHSWVTRLLATLLVLYLSYLGAHLFNYFIKKRFGRPRDNGTGERVIAETYNSRLLSLVSSIVLFIVALISTVQILGFDNLLHAGGVIGFVGVLLALTQASWAPDIISGLIILNSKLMDEGDVIEIHDGQPIIGSVFKTKIFHTEILDLATNNRIMIQNARLRQMTLNNLSKFASARGLRQELRFKIGYEVTEEQVNHLFQVAYEEAAIDTDSGITNQYPLEVRAVDAGDFAVEWSVFFYTKEVRRLLRTRQLFLGLILRQATIQDVSLATPKMYKKIS
ncbi:MAG: mechanosensitive ion channel family protein [Gammaproteobacteria bacterium]|nr:mechanosensitive ion channel family protein [Gammaproteobacteria bacterium]